MAQAGVKKPSVAITEVDGCKDYTSIKYLDELNRRQCVSGRCDAASAAGAIGHNCNWCADAYAHIVFAREVNGKQRRCA